MIYDEIAARYPHVFDNQPRRQPQACEHSAQFAELHRHIDSAAALQHRHLNHVEGTIMAAFQDLQASVADYASNVDNTVIPAFDAIMTAVREGSGGASEEQLAELNSTVQGANSRLLAKAQEAAQLVGGEG